MSRRAQKLLTSPLTGKLHCGISKDEMRRDLREIRSFWSVSKLPTRHDPIESDAIFYWNIRPGAVHQKTQAVDPIILPQSVLQTFLFFSPPSVVLPLPLPHGIESRLSRVWKASRDHSKALDEEWWLGNGAAVYKLGREKIFWRTRLIRNEREGERTRSSASVVGRVTESSFCCCSVCSKLLILDMSLPSFTV